MKSPWDQDKAAQNGWPDLGGEDGDRIQDAGLLPGLPVEVEEKVKSIDVLKDVEVEITFDPTWTQELMSEEAKLELGML